MLACAVEKLNGANFGRQRRGCINCAVTQLGDASALVMDASALFICLQLPPPRLVYKLFAGGKVMLVIFQFSIKVVVVVVVG